MKKSHPIRCRALAARRTRQARTLAARRHVEFQATLIAYRRAVMARPRPISFAGVVQRLRAGLAVDLATLFGLGIGRVPPSGTITYRA